MLAAMTSGEFWTLVAILALALVLVVISDDSDWFA